MNVEVKGAAYTADAAKKRTGKLIAAILGCVFGIPLLLAGAFLLSCGKETRYALFHEVPSYVDSSIDDQTFQDYLEELSDNGIHYECVEGAGDFSKYKVIIEQKTERSRFRINNVTFTYCMGEDLTGMDYAEAAARLGNAGWYSQRVGETVSTDVPLEEVVEQEVFEGRKMVVLTVNEGIADSEIGSFVGMNASDAAFLERVRDLESKNITCVIESKRESDFSNYGKITSQEITARNENGTVKEVTFVKIIEPSFVGTVRKQAVAQLTSMGQPYTMEDDRSGSAADDMVTGQRMDESTGTIILTVARRYSSELAYTEGFVYPDSATRIISESEYKSLSYEQLGYATMELYARHGFPFQDRYEYRNYYSQFSWYHPEDINAETCCLRMTAVEGTNLDHMGDYWNHYYN